MSECHHYPCLPRIASVIFCGGVVVNMKCISYLVSDWFDENICFIAQNSLFLEDFSRVTRNYMMVYTNLEMHVGNTKNKGRSKGH